MHTIKSKSRATPMDNPIISPLSVPKIQTTTDLVFEALYKAIATLELPPGQKVSEAEIAKQFSVSRQPVRDAFFRLSNLGLLEIRPQRATLISKISEQAVLDATFVRTALELECVGQAIKNITSPDLDNLHQIVDAQSEFLDTSERTGFHALDEAFHKKLCQIAGHLHAWSLIQEQKAHMDRVRFLVLSQERRHRVLAEHTGILDAIEAKDCDLANCLMRAHLDKCRSFLDQVVGQQAEYFDLVRPMP